MCVFCIFRLRLPTRLGCFAASCLGATLAPDSPACTGGTAWKASRMSSSRRTASASRSKRGKSTMFWGKGAFSSSSRRPTSSFSSARTERSLLTSLNTARRSSSLTVRAPSRKRPFAAAANSSKPTPPGPWRSWRPRRSSHGTPPTARTAALRRWMAGWWFLGSANLGLTPLPAPSSLSFSTCRTRPSEIRPAMSLRHVGYVPAISSSTTTPPPSPWCTSRRRSGRPPMGPVGCTPRASSCSTSSCLFFLSSCLAQTGWYSRVLLSLFSPPARPINATVAKGSELQ
mmetsp:Transcript_21924/g.62240  ORF Transcript_21924/g.62240 Transcript_21924/m.62240 type:complete len:286 (-) Transcript_21924:3-860(-)